MTEQGAQKKKIKDQAVEKCQLTRVKRDWDAIRGFDFANRKQLSGDPKIKV